MKTLKVVEPKFGGKYFFATVIDERCECGNVVNLERYQSKSKSVIVGKCNKCPNVYFGWLPKSL